jgi:formylmethanofuran dehydrogenase subunit B
MSPAEEQHVQQSASEVFADVACTVCGCVCDDLRVSVTGGQIAHIDGACRLARPWFESLAQSAKRPPALVDGSEASLDAALDRAADILRRSRAPLIWGLSRSSTVGQRAAVRLAEQLGANIDTTASVCHGPSIMAIQEVGESTCSLGEVRNRADLVIFWGADPVLSHPRHLERYSGDAKGLFIPGGRADRTIVVVDAKPTETSRVADAFLQVPANRDFEVIWALRQMLRGVELPEKTDVGVPHSQLKQLVTQMKSCRYGVVFFGLGLAQTGLGHANVEALLRLVEDLNEFARFTARRLRIPGDVAGADSVLCWLTGFPFAVNFSRGYPRYNPGEYTANELLERGEVDACLFVGSEFFSELSPKAQQAVQQMPAVVLDYPNAAPPFEPTARISTAIYGVHNPGTAYRMDEIPIPLRPFLSTSLPTDEQVLTAIARRMV